MSSLIQQNSYQQDEIIEEDEEVIDLSLLKKIIDNNHQIDDNNDNKTDDTSSMVDIISENSELYRKSSIRQQNLDGYQHSTLMIRMLNLCKEVIVMILIAIAYAALVNDHPPKISKSPSAYPFFTNDTIIKDWYRGEITKAIEQARKTDIAFVMFYAPWSAESQQIRNEFELTANYLHQQIEFIAINCWQPGSECQKQYNKVYKWPILIAYPINSNGIQYNGPYNHYYMIKFLQNIYKPLVLPVNVNDLIVRHDAVVLANIDCLPGSREFSIYYLTSLKFLERDPLREIIFAIMPQKRQISNNDNVLSPKLHLYLWNETISFNGKWDVDTILNWILKNLDQIIGWVSPSGTKSLSLSNYIQPGPALILFTPRNPFLQQIDYYSVLKEVAFDYYNCANDNTIKLKQRLLYLERLKNRVNYAKTLQKCFKNKSSTTNQLENTTNLCRNCRYFNNEFCQLQYDYRSAENLREFYENEECRNFHLSEKYQNIIFSTTTITNINKNQDNTDDLNIDNITGLACKQNRSLVLIAMDSLRYYHFAEKLGIDLFKSNDKTGVVIVDDSMETHYIMDADFSQINLLNFIKNYTNNRLIRALNSTTSIKSKNTHVYRQLKISQSSTAIYLKELNTENFLTTIQQTNRAFIIFYYTKQCAFCSGISHVLLLMAQLLKTIKQIEFVRIDGDLNLLPWEYTMESYPTILFMPTIKKSESRVFPKNIPITVPNLLNFLLANLEPELRLRVMWTICKQNKYQHPQSECMVSLRIETLSIIDDTLKQWRLFDKRRRPEILYKLQLLKHLHLLFAHQTNKLLSINNYLNKLEFFKRIQHDEL